MIDILFGLGVGLVFAFGALMGFGVLISIGYILEWFERRSKK
tara:strand:- start:470 stop:595 length:126 start_codon:yes stop_codon:yes gene_type:complete